MTKVFTSITKGAPTIQGNINVIPNKRYLVDVEIVVSSHHEYADITLDGKNFGSCNPSYSCAWHNCTERLNGTHVERQGINSTDGIILFEATYSHTFFSKYSALTCTVDGFTGTAIVRVTLIPENDNSTYSLN